MIRAIRRIFKMHEWAYSSISTRKCSVCGCDQSFEQDSFSGVWVSVNAGDATKHERAA